MTLDDYLRWLDGQHIPADFIHACRTTGLKVDPFHSDRTVDHHDLTGDENEQFLAAQRDWFAAATPEQHAAASRERYWFLLFCRLSVYERLRTLQACHDADDAGGLGAGPLLQLRHNLDQLRAQVAALYAARPTVTATASRCYWERQVSEKVRQLAAPRDDQGEPVVFTPEEEAFLRELERFDPYKSQ